MARTPGLIVPSAYSSKKELMKDLLQRNKAAGFTPFDASEFDEDVVEHYGVKGMKWGVHRSDGSRVDLTNVGKTGIGAARAYRSPDKTKQAFKQHVSTKGGLHQVRDVELQAMLKRMEMEKKYTTFMNEEKERRKKGQVATLKFLGEAGKIALPVIIAAVAGRYASGPAATRAYAYVSRPAINMARRVIGS